MIHKLEKRLMSMNIELFNPKEMYYLILALKELEFYKIILGENEKPEIVVSTLSPEDYD